MAGFGGGDGERDCFQVAHFAHHDDIRVLPEGAAQCRSEGFGVGVHFPLVHLAALGREEVFDRILQSDDVFVAGAVHFFDQCGKGRALAASDGAVTRTSPFWYWVSILSCGGKLSSSIDRTLVWMIRKTRS